MTSSVVLRSGTLLPTLLMRETLGGCSRVNSGWLLSLLPALLLASCLSLILFLLFSNPSLKHTEHLTYSNHPMLF